MKTQVLLDVEKILSELSATIRAWQPDKRILQRIEYEITPVDPLAWLAHLDDAHKLYWSDRERKNEIAATGKLIVFQGWTEQELQNDMQRMEGLLQQDNRIKFFGGMRFTAQKPEEQTWHAFPYYHFHLPAFELLRKNDRYYFVCNLYRNPQQTVSSLRTEYLNSIRRLFPGNGKAKPATKLLQRTDNPDRRQWIENVRSALKILDGKPLEKIVLARRSCLTFNHRPKAETLLQQFRTSNPNSFLFLIQPDKDNIFFGNTPERLFKRSQRLLWTEAVAGTRRRGLTPEEDRKLKDDLLHCEKDLREHDYVVQSIDRVLKEHSVAVSKEPQVGILENARVQHLVLRFKARLKDNVHDMDVLRDLHPTPAVGGVPKEEALRKIGQLEQFDRGWYAGPIGWISRDGSEFAVGIRSALLQGKTVHLFAGAGIVQGSDPELEWNELENKIANFLKILGVQ